MNLDWTHSPLWLIVNALVAYRLTRLWVDDMLPPLPRVRRWIEDQAEARWGPWVRRRQADTTTAYNAGIPYQVREWPEKADDERTESLYDHTPPLAYLASCYWCSGFWISLGVVLVASLVPLAIWTVPALALAFSAVVGLVAARTN